MVDAVASATADATLSYLCGSGGTGRRRPDSDLDVALLCSEPRSGCGDATRTDEAHREATVKYSTPCRDEPPA